MTWELALVESSGIFELCDNCEPTDPDDNVWDWASLFVSLSLGGYKNRIYVAIVK